MIAGPSASVMKKIASVFFPLNSHVIAHLPCCFIFVPPYAVRTVGDCRTASGLGKPSGLRYSGTFGGIVAKAVCYLELPCLIWLLVLRGGC